MLGNQNLEKKKKNKTKEKATTRPSSTESLASFHERLTGLEPIRYLKVMEGEPGQIKTGVVFYHRVNGILLKYFKWNYLFT